MENSASFEIIEDLRQSEQYGSYMESIGWKVLRVQSKSRCQIFLKILGPVGIVKIQRTMEKLPMEEIENIIKNNHVMMTKIEPLRGEKPQGYRVSSWPLLGTKTLRVNLRPSEDEILNSFKKDCRYVLRKIKNHKSKIKNSDFDKFYEIWKISAGRKSLWIPKEKEYKSLIDAFGKNVFCLTIENLAGALVLVHKKTAFYYYAGSTAEGTKLNLPYLVVWEAMKEARNKGCRMWDFEGIHDARWPNKGWIGFSHFKKSFGGKEVEFPGSFEKWRWPF